MNVFVRPPTVNCRSCAATHAPEAGHDIPNVCAYCWKRFVGFNGMNPISENAFNRWLARETFLTVRRMQKYKVAGRCEAITAGPRGWLDGHDRQCLSLAVYVRDGRRVCGQHQRTKKPRFVGQPDNDPYDAMRGALTSLAAIDPLFRQCLEEALAGSLTPTTTTLVEEKS